MECLSPRVLIQDPGRQMHLADDPTHSACTRRSDRATCQGQSKSPSDHCSDEEDPRPATHSPFPDRRPAAARLAFSASRRRENHGPGPLARRADRLLTLGRARPGTAHRPCPGAERSGPLAAPAPAGRRRLGRTPSGRPRCASGGRHGAATGVRPRLACGHPCDPGRRAAHRCEPGAGRLDRDTLRRIPGLPGGTATVSHRASWALPSSSAMSTPWRDPPCSTVSVR